MSEPGTLATLGKIITTNQQRDAVHIAVAPVYAAEDLRPGQRVGLNAEGHAIPLRHNPRSTKKTLGIVDPFLDEKTVVLKGQQFWLYLYPNTITGLHHLWTHPAFPDAFGYPEVFDRIARSREWIERIAAECDQTYEYFMEAAHEYVRSGEATYDNSESYKNDAFESRIPEFWDHFEIVTGITPTHRESFFTCAC